MADNTRIEWTDASLNVVTGCTRVSPGCDNCYMMAQWPRLHGMNVNGYEGEMDEVAMHEDRLEIPYRWQKPRKVFVSAMGDLFHPRVPWPFVCKVFEAMAFNKRHTFQVLTKRPGRMAYFAKKVWPNYNGEWFDIGEDMKPRRHSWPENVWAGTSVESAKYLPRLDVLAKVPAPVRFVSCEPLLGPLDLDGLHPGDWLRCHICRGTGEVDGGMSPGGTLGFHGHIQEPCPACEGRGRKVDWVIVGGESGPAARPMHPDWTRSMRDQCHATGVPFFFKQWGEWAVTNEASNRRTWCWTWKEEYPFIGWPRCTPGDAHMIRVGRKAAGALLDGVQHKEFPA